MRYSYKGDVTPENAYKRIEAKENSAFMIDVRTQAECTFVGIPQFTDMSDYVVLEWATFPTMSLNTTFIEQCNALLKRRPEPVREVYLLCRSGNRSHYAGLALEQAQTTEESSSPITVYNVAGGFEGDLDPQLRQRSRQNGWKVSGLPWQQN